MGDQSSVQGRLESNSQYGKGWQGTEVSEHGVTHDMDAVSPYPARLVEDLAIASRGAEIVARLDRIERTQLRMTDTINHVSDMIAEMREKLGYATDDR